MTYYSIAFDARYDSPDIEVLDYKYGELEKVFFAPERERIRLGQTFKGDNLNGFLPRGEFLYVKWRIKETGEILEDRVDLRNRLPENLEGLHVHFVCHGRQLYVFVRWPWDGLPSKREPNRDEYKPIPSGTKRYEGHKVQQIYPEQWGRWGMKLIEKTKEQKSGWVRSTGEFGRKTGLTVTNAAAAARPA